MVSYFTNNEDSSGVPVAQQLMLVAFILVLVLGSAVTPRIISGIKGAQSNTPAAIPYTTPDTTPTPATSTQQTFFEVAVTAEAAYVWDIQNQRALYKKAEGDTLPLASVTKLMTALLAHEILPEDTPVTISAAAIAQDGDSGLREGETFTRLTLSDFILLSSSNDGAYALAETAGAKLDQNAPLAAFVGAMNVRAGELGLSSVTFYNPTGLDLSVAAAGAHGSARDMAFLMEHIVMEAPELLAFTSRDDSLIYNQNGDYHEATNTNYYIDEIPGLIGSKTGYTDLAGGNLVVAYDAGLNRPIVIAVLGSTQVSRFLDVVTLLEETNRYVAAN